MKHICSIPNTLGNLQDYVSVQGHQCNSKYLNQSKLHHHSLKNRNSDGLRGRSKIARFYENNLKLIFPCKCLQHICRLRKLLIWHHMVTVRLRLTEIFSEWIMKMESSCICVSSSLQLRTATKSIVCSSIEVYEVALWTSQDIKKLLPDVRWHIGNNRKVEGRWVWHKPCYCRRSVCHVGSTSPWIQPHQVL